MKCPSCVTLLRPDEIYCHNCGIHLESFSCAPIQERNSVKVEPIQAENSVCKESVSMNDVLTVEDVLDEQTLFLYDKYKNVPVDEYNIAEVKERLSVAREVYRIIDTAESKNFINDLTIRFDNNFLKSYIWKSKFMKISGLLLPISFGISWLCTLFIDSSVVELIFAIFLMLGSMSLPSFLIMIPFVASSHEELRLNGVQLNKKGVQKFNAKKVIEKTNAHIEFLENEKLEWEQKGNLVSGYTDIVDGLLSKKYRNKKTISNLLEIFEDRRASNLEDALNVLTEDDGRREQIAIERGRAEAEERARQEMADAARRQESERWYEQQRQEKEERKKQIQAEHDARSNGYQQCIACRSYSHCQNCFNNRGNCGGFSPK